MKVINKTCLVFLVLGLLACTSKPKDGKTNISILNKSWSQQLKIEHKGYRGSMFTDSTGITFNLRSNPMVFSNLNDIPVVLSLNFDASYSYPSEIGRETFRIFLLPSDWARDRTSDSLYTEMFKHLPQHMAAHRVLDTIQSGEVYKFAIATLYPMPGETWSVVPNELFVIDSTLTYPDCEWSSRKVGLSETEVELGLKLHFIPSCKVIPIGGVSLVSNSE